MTLDEIKVYGSLAISFVNLLFTGGVWVYVRYGDRNKEIDRKIADVGTHIDEQVGKLRDELDDHRSDEGRRLGALEVAIARAPTHQDLGALHEKMNTTSNQVNQMAGELKGISDTLRLILHQITEKGMK